MAKSEFFTVKNTNIVTKNCVDKGAYFSFNMADQKLGFARLCLTDLGNGKFEISGGNNSERARVIAFFTMADRKETFGTSNPATEKQISYLETLVARDPANAMAFGASTDGVRIVAGLSKEKASELIDQMLNG